MADRVFVGDVNMIHRQYENYDTYYVLLCALHVILGPLGTFVPKLSGTRKKLI